MGFDFKDFHLSVVRMVAKIDAIPVSVRACKAAYNDILASRDELNNYPIVSIHHAKKTILGMDFIWDERVPENEIWVCDDRARTMLVYNLNE